MLHVPSIRFSVLAVLLVSTVGSAGAQTLQEDDLLLLRYGCGGLDSRVEAYRPSTGLRVLATSGGNQGCWEGVVGLPSGGFATGRKPSGVNVFDAQGLQTSTFQTLEVRTATDVAAFSDGSLAVLDITNGDVEHYSQTGQYLGRFSDASVVYPWGICIDSSDVLWVANRVTVSIATGAISRFDKSTAWLGTFTIAAQCDDLVVASDGTMWGFGQTGTVFNYHADGTLLSSFSVSPPGLTLGITMLSDGSLVLAGKMQPYLSRYDVGGTLLGQIPIHVDNTAAYRLAVVGDWQWQTAGDGIAGTGGVPTLSGKGTLMPGAVTQLELTNAAPNASTVLIIGTQRVDLPLLGGTLVPSADLLLQPIPTGAGGSWTLAGTWPAGVPAGVKLWFQTWLPDVAGPQGYAASNGLEATAP